MSRFLSAIACLLTLCSCQDNAKRERQRQLIEIFHGNTGDPDVLAAITRARETLPTFLAAMQKPANGQHTFLVKRAFPTEDPARRQILWVSELSYDGTLLHGRLDDKTAEAGTGAPRDGRVSFPPSEIADWMYHDNGKAAGGYLLRVLREKFPDEWAAKRYGEKIQFLDTP